MPKVLCNFNLYLRLILSYEVDFWVVEVNLSDLEWDFYTWRDKCYLNMIFCSSHILLVTKVLYCNRHIALCPKSPLLSLQSKPQKRNLLCRWPAVNASFMILIHTCCLKVKFSNIKRFVSCWLIERYQLIKSLHWSKKFHTFCFAWQQNLKK